MKTSLLLLTLTFGLHAQTEIATATFSGSIVVAQGGSSPVTLPIDSAGFSVALHSDSSAISATPQDGNLQLTGGDQTNGTDLFFAAGANTPTGNYQINVVNSDAIAVTVSYVVNLSSDTALGILPFSRLVPVGGTISATVVLYNISNANVVGWCGGAQTANATITQLDNSHFQLACPAEQQEEDETILVQADGTANNGVTFRRINSTIVHVAVDAPTVLITGADPVLQSGKIVGYLAHLSLYRQTATASTLLLTVSADGIDQTLPIRVDFWFTGGSAWSGDAPLSYTDLQPFLSSVAGANPVSLRISGLEVTDSGQTFSTTIPANQLLGVVSSSQFYSPN